MTATAGRISRADRFALRVERALRMAADPRLGVALLLLAALMNAVAAAAPRWRWLLDSPAYLLVIGAILLTGIASIAVRSPAAWREWRRPAPLRGGGQMLVAEIPTGDGTKIDSEALAHLLRRSGYRSRRSGGGARWQLAGVRSGWSRFAGIGSHLSLVVLVVGAGIGTAFSEETRFGLFPGEQSFMAEPRPGITSAVRLDRLDASFDDNGLPTRFDTHVTFLREGRPVRSQILRVNEPGDFDGHLVHAWTYGPAVAVRVEDLGGATLFDGWVALGGEASGSRAPFVELPQLGATIGFEIVDARANTLAAIVADKGGRVLATARIGPGERARVGSTTVALDRFSSYVTFLSRRDPGVLVLFAGAGLLCASLVAAFYWPRRRIDLSPVPGGLRLRMRGDRFDDPRPELDRLVRHLRAGVA